MSSRNIVSVTIMSGPKDGQQMRFPLPPVGVERTISIGRSEDCDITLPFDNQVSRTHARLVCLCSDDTLAESEEVSLLRLRLADVGSRNGTYVGERRLQGEEIELEPGQLFRVGRTWLRVDP